MKPQDRYAWIVKYLKDHAPSGSPYPVDVLNRYFSDAYIDATGAKTTLMIIGADKCPQLGRDLAAMARDGILVRHTTGITDGLCHQGFPRWVWSYRLAPPGRQPQDDEAHEAMDQDAP